MDDGTNIIMPGKTETYIIGAFRREEENRDQTKLKINLFTKSPKSLHKTV